MSRTPAATLARLKVTYPTWAISKREGFEGETVLAAVHPSGRSALAATPAEMEVRLLELDTRDAHSRAAVMASRRRR